VTQQEAGARSVWPVWDWAFVAGSAQSRKPAVKKPKRHQWLFCNPNYDPHAPLPPKPLPPHAPGTAQLRDERHTFAQLLPAHEQASDRKFRQQFVRWLSLRDVDWRNAFTQGLATDAKALRRKRRHEQRERRHQAWQQFKMQLAAPPSRPVAQQQPAAAEAAMDASKNLPSGQQPHHPPKAAVAAAISTKQSRSDIG
jgi:hypothetical protein